MTRFLLIISLICATGCRASGAKTDGTPPPFEPFTYESLGAWHARGGLQHDSWPRAWYLDLNADGSEEVFLGIEAYGRGMGYAVFTHGKSGWVMVADRVEGSSRPFELLAEQHEGWHDFMAVLPSGRDGHFEFVYTWDGKNYVQKSDREVKSTELSHK